MLRLVTESVTNEEVSLESLSDIELLGRFASKVLGCDSHFHAPYGRYCCFCKDHAHCCDQQCSIIECPDFGELNLMLEDSGNDLRVRRGEIDKKRQALIILLQEKH